MDDAHVEDGEHHNKDGEVAPALISVHPNQNSVGVAVGLNLRVFDLIGDCGVTLVDESNELFHMDSIGAIRFGAKGKLFVSAGDDKLVKIWSAESWHCIATVFVSCLAFVYTPDYPEDFLVSGSGDSTISLWDIISASLLDTCGIVEKAGHLSSDGNEEVYAAVTDPCTIPDCTLIAAAIQNFQGIMLLSWDLSCRTLSIVKVVSITEETFIPTSPSSSITGGLLWMVTGISNLPPV
ncbi:hypothetical protein SLE2022_245190 [Rubroshorea leprosula]